jgi:ribosomal protein S18 acetylase RimI-like enzyme
MIDRNSLIFRVIQPSDKSRFITFLLENDVPQVTGTFTAFPLNETSASFITDREHKDIYNILLDGDRIIGFSMLRGFEDGFTVPSFGIMIDYRYHNLGLGKYLLNLTIEQAKHMGCAKVRLSVYGSNLAGLKIYEAIGFHEVERTWVDLHGFPDEKIIMIKELI